MKKILSIILCLTTVLGSFVSVSATKPDILDTLIPDTAEYILNTVTNPQVGSIGGEWAVLGLARSGVEVPEGYFENYYNNVESYVADCGGILSKRKYTEYSRVILALTAIGKNPQNVAGYNLLTPLADYEAVTRQGINGSVWALLALDSADYEIPENPGVKVLATREMYINHILENQTPDGGWALTGESADADVSAMALQALSKYQDNEAVASATEKALLCVSRMQNENGGFSGNYTESSEGSAQILVALCELGIPFDDLRFVKNSNTILDNLLTYYDEGNGFLHIQNGDGSNLMATEQVFYSLAALSRQADGKSSLYRMGDVPVVTNTVLPPEGGSARTMAEIAQILFNSLKKAGLL